MSDCLVTGMPNVGKTCFVINFAEYMGLQELKFYMKQQAGYTSINSYSPEEAMSRLVSANDNFTKNVQSINIEIPAGKTYRRMEIIDSCGLTDGIHHNEEIRKAMAKTLGLIRKSSFILHMIDVLNINKKGEILMPVDRMILKYALKEKKYAILINKIDLIYASNKIEILKQQLHNTIMIPISALYKRGFKEVKKLVLNYG